MISTLAPLSERFRFGGASDDEIFDALAELEAWRDEFYDTPKEIARRLEDLEQNQRPLDYDDLKSFFEDCVEALNDHWPAAEAYDQNLRQVICSAIARGDIADEDLTKVREVFSNLIKVREVISNLIGE